jgi:hypothetical protein
MQAPHRVHTALFRIRIHEDVVASAPCAVSRRALAPWPSPRLLGRACDPQQLGLSGLPVYSPATFLPIGRPRRIACLQLPSPYRNFEIVYKVRRALTASLIIMNISNLINAAGINSRYGVIMLSNPNLLSRSSRRARRNRARKQGNQLRQP